MPFSYLWSSGETASTISPTQNGTFWLIITDNNGCISDTTFILFDNLPNGIKENIGDKNLVKITDILGRNTKGKKNEVIFYIYDDGTVEKKLIMD